MTASVTVGARASLDANAGGPAGTLVEATAAMHLDTISSDPSDSQQVWQQVKAAKMPHVPAGSSQTGKPMIAGGVGDCDPPLRRHALSSLAECAVIALLPLLALAYLPAGPAGLDAARLPREFALAGLAGCALVGMLAAGSVCLSIGEWLLVASVGSAILSTIAAANAYLALRASAISLSSIILGLAIRRMNTRMRRRAIMWLYFAAALAAVIALAEGAHIVPNMSLPSRGPGGVFLHRNAAAQFVTVVLPAGWWLAHTCRRRLTLWLVCCTTTCMTCFITLSRCRGAWVAAGTGALVLLACAAWEQRTLVPSARRTCWITSAAAGVLFAIPLSGKVGYTERRPLIATASRLFDIRSGSGEGRVQEMENSIHMWQDAPLLGAGPGNWSVEYTRYAPINDPSRLEGLLSVDSQPHSDYVGLVTERGLLGVGLIAAALVVFLRRLTRPGLEPVAAATASATLLVAFVMGAADPIVLTAAGLGALVVILGALVPQARAGRRDCVRLRIAALEYLGACGACLGTFVAIVFLFRSVLAASEYARPHSKQLFAHAAQIAPWDYRAQMLLSAAYISQHECAAASEPLRRAHALEPYWPAPVELGEECDPPVIAWQSAQARLPLSKAMLNVFSY